MSQLDQIQLSFVPGEDRLLLRVTTQDPAEFRFWLTRRLVKALRPAFDQTLGAQPEIRTQADPVARRELLSFQREQAVQSSDFQTPFSAETRPLPLGDAPVVLTRFQVRPREEGGVVLALAPEQGNGIDLALSPPLLHSLTALLEKTLAATDWDLAPAADGQGSVETPSDPAALN